MSDKQHTESYVSYHSCTCHIQIKTLEDINIQDSNIGLDTNDDY